MPNHSILNNSAEKIFEATLQKVEGKLVIRRKELDVGLKLLNRFEELKKYKSLFVHKVTELKGEHGSFMVMLIEKHLTIVVQRKNGRVAQDIEEVEPVIVFSVPHNIGRVYIRRETLADKLTGVFEKADVDIDAHPKFSKNYYVTAEKPDEVKNYLPENLIAALERPEDIMVEINGNWGLMRTEKNLSESVLISLLNIGYWMIR